MMSSCTRGQQEMSASCKVETRAGRDTPCTAQRSPLHQSNPSLALRGLLRLRRVDACQKGGKLSFLGSQHLHRRTEEKKEHPVLIFSFLLPASAGKRTGSRSGLPSLIPSNASCAVVTSFRSTFFSTCSTRHFDLSMLGQMEFFGSSRYHSAQIISTLAANLERPQQRILGVGELVFEFGRGRGGGCIVVADRRKEFLKL
jgi:hypothetical protein